MVGTTQRITRRAFLQAAAAAGAAALPVSAGLMRVLESGPGAETFGVALADATAPDFGTGPYFFSTEQLRTAAAICARIIPTDTNPLTGAVVVPGAAEANAVRFIDLFLAAFELPTLAPEVASNPAIYLTGRYSGRWPSGNPATGAPFAANTTPDAFEAGNGEIQFLGLSANQAVAWYLRIYGTTAGMPSSLSPPWQSKAWYAQVETPYAPGTAAIPGATPLRALYGDPATGGLAAFDSWSEQNFGVPFAQASAPEQDALLFLAWNPILGAASSNGLPGLPAPLPNPVPPPAASALFPVMVLHTIQGCYGLPEYGGNADRIMWPTVGWDGDTQPLGSSIYFDGPGSPGPGQGPNAGFGFAPGNPANPPAAFTPRGTYVEYRPVSTPDGSDGTVATVADFTELIAALNKIGTVTIVAGGGGA